MNFFDLHCDTPYEGYKRGELLCDGNLAVTLKKGKTFERWCQVLAIWVPDECRDPRDRYERVLSDLKVRQNVGFDRFSLDTDPSFILSLEGGALIETVDDVDALFLDGVRIVTLTWNGQNKIAGGCNTAGTLTDFGRDVITRMNELSMVVDVSHLNDRSFFEVVKHSHRVIATHTACRALTHVRRNMTDLQIRAVIEKGGLIGLCFYPRFLGQGDVFARFREHLQHVLMLGGEDFVAVGSDFDGAVMAPSLDSLEKVHDLYSYLSESGFSDSLLNKLFFENAFKYFKEL